MSIQQSKQQLSLPPAEEYEAQLAAARAELIGDVARDAFDAARSAKSDQERDLLDKQAQQASTIRRNELQALVPDQSSGKLTNWICNMPIKPRQMMILARIYSFQASGLECHMTLAALGADTGIRVKQNLINALTELVDAGYLFKRSNGNSKPRTYIVDVPRCMDAAIANGWEPLERSASKTDDKETAQQDGEQHKQ